MGLIAAEPSFAQAVLGLRELFVIARMISQLTLPTVFARRLTLHQNAELIDVLLAIGSQTTGLDPKHYG